MIRSVKCDQLFILQSKTDKVIAQEIQKKTKVVGKTNRRHIIICENVVSFEMTARSARVEARKKARNGKCNIVRVAHSVGFVGSHIVFRCNRGFTS